MASCGVECLEVPVLIPCEGVSEFEYEFLLKTRKNCMACVVISNYVTYNAITTNLMDLLTNYWHMSLPNAASTVNIQSGLTALSAIMWTFLGDAYFSGYRIVLYSIAFYAFGLGILATSPPSRHLFKVEDRCWAQSTVTKCIGSKAEALVFCGSFIFIVVGDGHKPVLKVFGADQFTVHNKDDKKRAEIMLLIWWGSGVIVGGIVGMQVLSEVERKGSSLVGYGISAVVKMLALFLFVSGTKFYEQVKPSGSPLPNVLRVFVPAVRKGYLQPPEDSNQLYEKPNEKGNTEFLPHTNRLRRFNDEDKKLIIDPQRPILSRFPPIIAKMMKVNLLS